jgi:hemoglobin-like flavoprotein
MTPEHEAAIRASWAAAATQAEAVAARFHARLVALDPAASAMFSATDPAAHERRLAWLLKELAEALDEPERLVAVLVPLGRRHATYGVREEQFALAGDALIEALRETLGETFTVDVEEAWRELVELVVAVMNRAVHLRG